MLTARKHVRHDRRVTETAPDLVSILASLAPAILKEGGVVAGVALMLAFVVPEMRKIRDLLDRQSDQLAVLIAIHGGTGPIAHETPPSATLPFPAGHPAAKRKGT